MRKIGTSVASHPQKSHASEIGGGDGRTTSSFGMVGDVGDEKVAEAVCDAADAADAEVVGDVGDAEIAEMLSPNDAFTDAAAAFSRVA
jgi:hypothetical protein